LRLAQNEVGEGKGKRDDDGGARCAPEGGEAGIAEA